MLTGMTGGPTGIKHVVVLLNTSTSQVMAVHVMALLRISNSSHVAALQGRALVPCPRCLHRAERCGRGLTRGCAQ